MSDKIKFENEVIHQPGFISTDQANELRYYYNEIVADWFSGQPYKQPKWQHGMSGCLDRPLRLERKDNPLHSVIEKLKSNFGTFTFYEGSIRYMHYPFGPHTELSEQQSLLEQRKKYKNQGAIFMIPLWWEENLNAGTVFFSNPPQQHEPLYIEHQDILPIPVEDSTVRNFSVRKIAEWHLPGDLIAWKNYVWHSSTFNHNYTYSDEKFCKEFISIEVRDL